MSIIICIHDRGKSKNGRNANVKYLLHDQSKRTWKDENQKSPSWLQRLFAHHDMDNSTGTLLSLYVSGFAPALLFTRAIVVSSFLLFWGSRGRVGPVYMSVVARRYGKKKQKEFWFCSIYYRRFIKRAYRTRYLLLTWSIRKSGLKIVGAWTNKSMGRWRTRSGT